MAQDGALRQLAAVEKWRLAQPFQVLLQSIGEAIYGLDRHGRCTFISRAAAEILGYTPDEVLGHSIHERIHHGHPAGVPGPPHSPDRGDDRPYGAATKRDRSGGP